VPACRLPGSSHFAAGCMRRLYPTGASKKGSARSKLQYASPKIAMPKRDRVARPERHVLEDAAVLAKRISPSAPPSR